MKEKRLLEVIFAFGIFIPKWKIYQWLSMKFGKLFGAYLYSMCLPYGHLIECMWCVHRVCLFKIFYFHFFSFLTWTRFSSPPSWSILNWANLIGSYNSEFSFFTLIIWNRLLSGRLVGHSGLNWIHKVERQNFFFEHWTMLIIILFVQIDSINEYFHSNQIKNDYNE